MKRSTKIGIVALILLLAIGFAGVTTSIIIGSSSKIGFNQGEFDIYFSDVDTDEESEASIDQQTRQSIDFSTRKLSAVGDYVILDYEVTNDSTIYDAKGTIEYIPKGNISDYVEVTMIGFEDETIVKARSTVSGRIKIALTRASSTDQELEFEIQLHFEPVERDKDASEEDEDNPDCVSDGYYVLKCSCDNRTIAWLGGPYYDDWGNKMNSTRTQELEYPPANTYKCYCGSNGEQQGYVVNTGDIEGTICGVDPPPSLGDQIGSSSKAIYGYDVTNYSVTINQTLPKYKLSGNRALTYVQDGTKEINETVDKWKLFYYDGEYAYLMASDPIHTTLVVGEEPRRIFDSDQVSEYGETSGNTTMISGSKLTASEEQEEAKTWATALNNPNYWTQFVNSTYAEEAYGSPTVEMWSASFNEKYPGYNMSASVFEANRNNGVFYGEKVNNKVVTAEMDDDTLYFCGRIYTEGEENNDSSKKSSSYYLSVENPNINKSYRVRSWLGDGAVLLDGTDTEMALRPVVKLKASVKGIIDDEHRTITLQ